MNSSDEAVEAATRAARTSMRHDPHVWHEALERCDRCEASYARISGGNGQSATIWVGAVRAALTGTGEPTVGVE